MNITSRTGRVIRARLTGAGAGSGRSGTGALVCMFVGTSWPQLVVAAGVMIPWHAVEGSPPRVHSPE